MRTQVLGAQRQHQRRAALAVIGEDQAYRSTLETAQRQRRRRAQGEIAPDVRVIGIFASARTQYTPLALRNTPYLRSSSRMWRTSQDSKKCRKLALRGIMPVRTRSRYSDT